MEKTKRTFSDVMVDLGKCESYDAIPNKLLDELEESLAPVPVLNLTVQLPGPDFVEKELTVLLRGLGSKDLESIRKATDRRESGKSSDSDYKNSMRNKINAQVLWSNGYQKSSTDYLSLDEMLLDTLLNEAGGDHRISAAWPSDAPDGIEGYPYTDNGLMARKDLRMLTVDLPSKKPFEGRFQFAMIVRRIPRNEFVRPTKHQRGIDYAREMVRTFAVWSEIELEGIYPRYPGLPDAIAMKLLELSKIEIRGGELKNW